MRKADIADALVERVGISRKESRELLELILTTIKETLGKGDSVKIAEFGSFLVRKKKERRGRNMKTGLPMQIQPRKVVRFKASYQLKKAVIK
ncbi:MAG: integration host factor subunit alpha [Nitrospirae bacterium]|nr:integration host factor subunit alpha [Candidatus Troglogloeales bacterium]MBI3598983.1 integration host factor subunit alpha [Candidatus Troglogloeales bacterium]